MELSERAIAQLEKEGFESVSECQAAAGTVFPVHSTYGKVAFFITDGSITFDVSEKSVVVQAPGRFNVPRGVLCTAQIGIHGAIYIMGEDVLTGEA